VTNPDGAAKNWFMTGSSGGLGRELVRTVLDRGDRVFATDLRTDGLDELAAEFGDRLRVAGLDVTDPAAAQATLRRAVTELGGLDVVVNGAGYRSVGSIEDMPIEDFRRNIDVNFYGTVNVSRAALPILRPRRGGHIMQVSSIGGRRAQAGLGAYQTSKWAVGAFSEVLAQEVGPLGVHVTVLEPGGMRTPSAQAPLSLEGIREDYQPTVGRFARTYNQNPDVQHGDPVKIAEVIYQLSRVPEPPVRLLIGSSSAWLAPQLAAARAEEDERWKNLGAATDVDDFGDFADTPVARMVSPKNESASLPVRGGPAIVPEERPT
jgi:NAD(P)-dependent dehydrogenase (short-subunit alcohol dehydrogenase family)